MKEQHTPGPWEAVPPVHDLDLRFNDGDPVTNVPAHIRRVYVNEDAERCTQIIADVYNGDSDEGAANAKLLAAGPTLLWALKHIQSELGVPGEGYPANVANAYEIAGTAIETAS